MHWEKLDMDVADLWRSMRRNASDAPHAGAHLQAAGAEIEISVSQECLVSLPSQAHGIPEVRVTVISHRPGVAAQVTIGANFNSPDGSYQGPTTNVAHGEFTTTSSEVQARFILMPAGFPVLGVGAFADFSDGVHSGALTYVQIACNPWVWWQWLAPIAGLLPRLSRR
jgi:hypothetical protein